MRAVLVIEPTSVQEIKETIVWLKRLAYSVEFTVEVDGKEWSSWEELKLPWPEGPVCSVEPQPVAYDREVLANVLVHHARTNTSGCHCGCLRLGASYPEHVADVYEETTKARLSPTTPQRSVE